MNYGRIKIHTDAEVITEANVVAEVERAYAIHTQNYFDIKRLWDAYRGKTAVLQKKKEIREGINFKITENHANEIVTFHPGYVFGEPIQYVRRENTASKTDDDGIAADINALNGYMADASKSKHDTSLAKWFYSVGTAYRLTLPNKKWTADSDESPVSIYTLDPHNTFVVYRNTIGEEPLMAVTVVEKEDRGVKSYSVYTEDAFYEFEDMGDVTKLPHDLGMIPIIEYPADDARLGVFEIVMTMLDAIDQLQSSCMDDIVQCVNSFLAILGGEVTKEVHERLEEWKMLCLPEGVDAKYLSAPMHQSDIQNLKEDLLDCALTICSVPNRNGGSSSTSDNGVAVVLRDGWQLAETKAKATEEMFKHSEKEFLKLVLRILRSTVGTKLRLSDITPHFTRRNYENIAAKSQVLIAMLGCKWIHPEVAYAACGIFPDPESAYLQGKAWVEEQEKKEAERRASIGTDPLPDVQPSSDGLAGDGGNSVSEV